MRNREQWSVVVTDCCCRSGQYVDQREQCSHPMRCHRVGIVSLCWFAAEKSPCHRRALTFRSGRPSTEHLSRTRLRLGQRRSAEPLKVVDRRTSRPRTPDCRTTNTRRSRATGAYRVQTNCTAASSSLLSISRPAEPSLRGLHRQERDGPRSHPRSESKGAAALVRPMCHVEWQGRRRWKSEAGWSSEVRRLRAEGSIFWTG